MNITAFFPFAPIYLINSFLPESRFSSIIASLFFESFDGGWTFFHLTGALVLAVQHQVKCTSGNNEIYRGRVRDKLSKKLSTLRDVHAEDAGLGRQSFR